MQTIKNPKKIFFIGRLEYEKWCGILLEIIQKSLSEAKNIEFHIFGDGLMGENFSHFDKNFVKMYGKVSREKIFSELKKADFLLMPSRFLETFGLVALESLSAQVPVIGFKKWWLSDFISEKYALDEKNPIKSFFEIICDDSREIVDISRFSYQNWQKNLIELTKDFSKILLVHDYSAKIGGAEIYVHSLKNELEKIGKTVELVAYEWEISSKIRKKLFLSAVFGNGFKKQIEQKIVDFQPDLVWSHTVLRAVGASGLGAIKKSKIPHFITHHDLGLFSVRPSAVFSLSDIPQDFSLTTWVWNEKKFFAKISAIIKFFIIRWMRAKISDQTVHILPSRFMVEVMENNSIKNYKIFPHTIF